MTRRTGEQLKLLGMARVDEAEAEAWKRKADAAILALARKPSPFTAEDVREIAGDPSHPNSIGRRFSAAASKGIIRVHGYDHANRASRHSALIRIWVGTPRALNVEPSVVCDRCGEPFGGSRAYELHFVAGRRSCLHPDGMEARGLERKAGGIWRQKGPDDCLTTSRAVLESP